MSGREAEKRTIRNSAKGLVVKDDKVLVIEAYDEDGKYYLMPGGGQKPGELLPETVRREVAEETGFWVAPVDLAFVIEGRNGEAWHRVDLVFRCELEGPVQEGDIVRQTDVNQVGTAWLPIATLREEPLYPSRLRRAIQELYNGRRADVYLGNEDEGDPEYE